MRILILGGTRFLGRAIVEAAHARDHDVTLFHRGETGADLFPGANRILGNRETDLSLLEGRVWDAAVDTCAYLPRIVRLSTAALAGAVQQYTFISSISVYDDVSRDGVDESASTGTIEDETIEEITGETYGPLKALCEKAAVETMDGRALIIRPGLIVGPNDPTDRFTYWPWRVSRGGEVLAPGTPNRRLQFIDVRDLAEWTVRLIEEGATGTFNAAGPAERPTMEELLRLSARVSGSDPKITWVPWEFLASRGIAEWSDMPLYVDESKRENGGFYAITNDRARAKGLTFRPVEETVRATLDWIGRRPAGTPWRAGIDAARERGLLEAWHLEKGETK